MGDPDKIDTKDWKSAAASWLASQGVSTVLLVAILAAMTYCGNYAVKTAIPAHLEQIQKGYREQANDNKETVRDINAAHERSMKQVTDTFDREMQWHRDHRTAKGME